MCIRDRVNAERAKENLAPLAMGDAKLQAAADERAKEVAKVASHTRPDGTNCFTVLKEYGVSDTATGENAAWGETTPEKVVADWMASEGHRVNIMDPAAKYMCLGYNYDAKMCIRDSHPAGRWPSGQPDPDHRRHRLCPPGYHPGSHLCRSGPQRPRHC